LSSYRRNSCGSGWRALFFYTAPPLHVAMQTGPYLHPVSRMFGVWPLRIPIRSALGFWRFTAGPVAGSASLPMLANKPEREATFSVYETNNPA
jgi:hypothetical protein